MNPTTGESSLAQSLQAYLPADRLQALAQNRPLPDRTIGSAVFADISGFTPLSEALSRSLGPRRGAEELTRQLNHVYDALVTQVACYSGSVISFSGDAITCWFDAAEGGGAGQAAVQSALSAVACALAMQAAMRSFSQVQLASGEIARLAMKIAVASGAARRFLVGDPSIQVIDILAGETLARMARAEHLAQRGEVLLDGVTQNLLAGQVHVTGQCAEDESEEQFGILASVLTQSPVFQLGERSLLPEASLQSWLLPPVYDRLKDGLGEFLMELRVAVAMFLRFQGIDYDGDDAAGEKLDAYIRWVQRVLDRYGGSLSNLTIGDKGSYIFGAFGAPIAYEDDPLRAVSAAWELRSPPSEFAYLQPPQIGINQGAVRSGAYGGKSRRTYGILGDGVNLASRLMQHAAPGEILASRSVQEASSVMFAWEALTPVRVKGKADPVPLARLSGRVQIQASPVGYSGAFIGRQVELKQLLQFLQPIFSPAQAFAGVAYIYGEAGVGKSRLVHELRQNLEANHPAGFSWFLCPAEQILRQSLNPFKHFLRQYFQQDSPTSETATRASFDLRMEVILNFLTRQAPSDVRAVEIMADLERGRSFLAAMVDLFWEGSLYAQLELEPKLRFANILAAFRALILAESLRRPVVLHIEDAHWLDPDSQALLKALLRNIRRSAGGSYPLAVLFTARGAALSGTEAKSIAQDAPLLEIDLAQLSQDGVGEMAAQLLKGEVTAETTAFLAAKTSGNPFFLEQLVLDLRERSMIRRVAASPEEGGMRWALAAQEMTELPATISAVLVARLDRLSARVKAVVQTASVLGNEFETLVLSRMMPEDPHLPVDIKQAETELIWAALSEARYLFRHTLLRDAAYEMQLNERLRDLHALAAKAIELLHAADLPLHFADLANHFEKAEQARLAFEYAQKAGQRAEAQFANHDAIEFFSRALRNAQNLDVAQTSRQRLAIHNTLGRLLTSTGQYERATEHLEQGCSLAEQCGDRQAQAQACYWWGRSYELRGEYSQALEWIDRGLAALGEGETAEAAELRLIAGLIYSRQGDQEHAWERAQSAMRIAQQAGEKRALARANNLLGHLTRLRGDSAAAIEYYQNSLALFQQAGDLQGQAVTYNLIGVAYTYMGQIKDAEDRTRRARQIFDQIGDLYNRAFVDTNLGELLLKRGDLDGAVTYYQAALRSMEQIGGSAYVLGALHNNLGAAFIRRSEPETARQFLSSSQRNFEQAQARDFLPELFRHFAEADLLAGDLDQAEQHGQEALALARELSMHGDEGSTLRVLGQAAAARKHWQAAEGCFQESIALLQKVGDAYETARSQLSLAEALAQQGKPDQAVSLLVLCVPVFEKLETMLELRAAQRLRSEL